MKCNLSQKLRSTYHFISTPKKWSEQSYLWVVKVSLSRNVLNVLQSKLFTSIFQFYRRV